MAGNNLFMCPAEGCDYGPATLTSCAAHFQGKRDDDHRGGSTQAVELMLAQGPVDQGADLDRGETRETMAFPDAEAPPAPDQVNELAEQLDAEGYEVVDRHGDLPRHSTEPADELPGPAPDGATCPDCGAGLRHLEGAMYVCAGCATPWEWEEEPAA